jgi:putative addiction module component (TIGR02574 family)
LFEDAEEHQRYDSRNEGAHDMKAANDNVFDAALALPPETRMVLVERLLESLKDEQAEIDAAWAQEIQRRIEAYERGEMEVIPMEDVFRSLRQETKP